MPDASSPRKSLNKRQPARHFDCRARLRKRPQRVAPPDPTLNMARDAVDRQVGHLVRLDDELLDVTRNSEGRITLKK